MAAVLLDVILLVLFGTALSSCILFPHVHPGPGLRGVGTIVSSGYGFICGAYMPISSFSKGLQNVVALLPGTYGTALMRNHAMNGPFAAMEAEGVPAAVIDAIRGQRGLQYLRLWDKKSPCRECTPFCWGPSYSWCCSTSC